METEIEVDGEACLVAALLLLLLPLNWLTGAFLAALFHELCHWGMIRLLGGRVYGLRIHLGGAVMETSPMTDGHELLSAVAGPVGSFLLLSLRQTFPQLAVCALVQGAFNLLPLYPLDGARILRRGANLLLPRYAERIAKAGALAAVVGISVGSMLLFLKGSPGIGPVFLVGFMILKAIRRKIPCKPGRIGVQ